MTDRICFEGDMLFQVQQALMNSHRNLTEIIAAGDKSGWLMTDRDYWLQELRKCTEACEHCHAAIGPFDWNTWVLPK